MASAKSNKPQINWEEEDDNDTGLPPPQHRSLHQNPPPPSWMARALDGDDSESLDISGNFGQQRNANSTNSGPPNNQRYSYPQMLDTSEYPRVRWSESESSLDNENDPMAGIRPDYFANNSGCSPIPRAITSSPVDSRPAPPPVGTGTVAGNSGMPRHRTYGMPGLQYSDSDTSSGSEEYSDAGQEPTASASQHQNQQPRVMAPIANAHSVSQPQAHQQAQVPAYFSCDSCSGPGFFSRPVPPSLKIPVRPIHMRNTNDEPPTNNNRVDAAGTDGLGIWEEAPDEPPLTQHGSNNMMRGVTESPSSQRTALSSTTSVGSNFTIVSDPHVSQYVERQQPLTGVPQVEDLSLSDGREELLDSFLTSNPSSTTNRTFGAAPPTAGATFTLNMSSEASEGTGSTLRGQHQQRAVQNSEEPFFLAEVGSLLQLAQKYELHFDVREDEGGTVVFSEQQSASSSGCRRILIMRSQIYQHGQVLEGLHISMYANGQLWREYDLPLVDTWLGLAVLEGVCISFFNSADHS